MSLSVSPPSSAVAVITPERSPRPTSAPAIAQSHAAEPLPAKPDVKDTFTASKVEKEAAKPDVRREEIPLEKAKPEPADASKVCQTRLSLEEAGASALEASPEQQLCTSSPPGQRGVYSSPRHSVGKSYGHLGPREISALTLWVQGRMPRAAGFWWLQSD